MSPWSHDVFARNLRHYMEREGLNQKEIAEIAGVSAPTVNDWIKAKKYPRIDKIEKLAKRFDILKSDLIEDKSDMQKKNDTISDIVLRMTTDEEFLGAVTLLNNLDDTKLGSIMQMLRAFSEK